MPWREQQEQFAGAVRDAGESVPDVVGKTCGQVSIKRFNVYRNNHAVGLIDALAANFPVTQRLVGEEFFRAVARAFVAGHPPQTPVLLAYGDEFPDFIDTFEPAGQVPFLADVARLEVIIAQSYHATDATPVGLERLSEFPENDLPSLRFKLHPSLGLLQSAWPIFTLWQMHQQEEQPNIQDIDWQGECGLSVRPAIDVDVERTAVETFDFLTQLNRGSTLAEAAAPLEAQAGMSLEGLLTYVFQLGAVVGVESARN